METSFQGDLECADPDKALREMTENFRLLFFSNPHPMWIYDLETLRFLEVNTAAVTHYGYSRKAFLEMTIDKIRPLEDVPKLLSNVENLEGGLDLSGQWRHIKKDGTLIHVEIVSHAMQWNGRQVELVVAHDLTRERHSRQALQRIEWMLTTEKDRAHAFSRDHENFKPEYGDLVALNTSRLILDAVGESALQYIVSEYLELLETSSAVYEKNGDCAFVTLSSGWCRLMDDASRKRCQTDDNRQAMTSGRWFCHESCWGQAAKAAIETQSVVDIPCTGGIRTCAVPIVVAGRVAGAISVGYGDPPQDPARILDLSRTFGLDPGILTREALCYESRPPFIIEMAKRRMVLSARLIGEIVERRLAEKALKRKAAVQALLANISARCIHLAPDRMDTVINEALEGIGSLLETDRSYVFFMNEKRRTVSNTHEWCAPGISSQKERLQEVPWDLLPFWIPKMERLEPIHISSVPDLPPERADEKRFLEAQEIVSLVAVPISWQQQFIGFIGFDSVRNDRAWDDEDVKTLQTLANIICLMVGRQRADREQKRLQERLFQSQKMESVGRLAGGVAHDFNNMLQAILGYADLALIKSPQDTSIHSDLKEIRKAALRSSDLTRQLLTFARRQAVNPQVLDLNEKVTGTLSMLQRLIGEDVELIWKPGAHLWPVEMDPSHVDQILANLSINARDAITGGGRITIETTNAVFDQGFCDTHTGFSPGDYVRLRVQDTGEGMSPEVMRHLFEPFFTTKGIGKGTGLGLATVYGIVKQNGGFIHVSSRPGAGATVDVHMPRAQKHLPGLAAAAENKAGKGGETVLIVEDEPSILELGKAVLEHLGYHVLAARSPKEALAFTETYPGRIHLLLTDVVMPGMNGKVLAERVLGLHPAMKVIFMSGYTSDVFAHEGILDKGTAFLQKPFTVQTLGKKVREVLGND